MDGKIVLGSKNRVMRPEFIPCDGVFNIPIFNSKNDIIGRAILTRHLKINTENGNGAEEAIVLLDVYIYKEEDRRQGAADDIMGFLVEEAPFTCILTGESTPAGKRLCLKHGFRTEVYGTEKFLVWRKINGIELAKG
jgi:hypothetical protein